ncbi:MAG: aspartate aminotransferase family protein [bacterium]|nr:aspartate aminotransferase family protein [bacterium]MCP5069614.1 aspartate aminotransferase family protein [bacterium]
MQPDTLLPELRTEIPGPRSRALAQRLARVESRNVTCLSPAPPIFWERAEGASVWDVDGNRFVDLGGGFGVANAGHAHPRVAAAVADQAGRLMHAMGDVHPPAVKVELLEALAALFPGGEPARSVLGSSGSDAVEIALETALLATGHAGLIAFEGGYHGLALGSLDATWRADFREPFATLLPHRTSFARFGDLDDVIRCAANASLEIGAVLVEPVQGRGGERVPPPGFLAALRRLCDERNWLLIADEVYTGFGRTGRTFACEHENVVPDLLCVAKGLASGMPISACIGRAEVMDCWPLSLGEALHTQTFLGHPPGCAAALASLAILEDEKLAVRASELGTWALDRIRESTADLASVRECRGLGMMIGIECDAPEIAMRVTHEALMRGFILLPSGNRGEVLSITPPLTIGSKALEAGLDTLARLLQ